MGACFQVRVCRLLAAAANDDELDSESQQTQLLSVACDGYSSRPFALRWCIEQVRL